MEFTDHLYRDLFNDYEYPAEPELPEPGAKGFHWADYLIFALFLIVSLGIGMFQGIAEALGCLKKKEQTTEEFLTGNRSFSIWPVALSMLSAFLSAILILGTPAEVYVEGTEYWIYLIGMMSACVFAVFLFVPLLYPLKLTSSYEVKIRVSYIFFFLFAIQSWSFETIIAATRRITVILLEKNDFETIFSMWEA